MVLVAQTVQAKGWEVLTLAISKAETREFATRLDIRHGRKRSQGESRVWDLSYWKGGLGIQGNGEDHTGVGLGQWQELAFGRDRFEVLIQAESSRLCLSGSHGMVHAGDINLRVVHMQMVFKTKRLNDITESVRSQGDRKDRTVKDWGRESSM